MESRFIAAMRRELNLDQTHISDADVLAHTKGTFLAARINLSLAVDGVKAGFKKAFRWLR